MPAEKESTMNKGVQGFEVIDEDQGGDRSPMPNTVSCADIIAFAARDSVFGAGGLRYAVLGGRGDGLASLIDEAAENLAGAFFNSTELRGNFARKGLSMEEMVTLSGAHSIGESHCSAFSKRLYSFSARFPQDPSMDGAYAETLKSKCPRPRNLTDSVDPVVAFDLSTPALLDNNYYKNLVSHRGLWASDQELWSSGLTRKMVKNNRNHPGAWASKFAAAMVNMGSIDVMVSRNGEIRNNCRAVN